MQQRTLAGTSVGAIGFGCMNLNHGYGTPLPADDGARLLAQAVELGVTLFDTAALYAFGANEELVGRALRPHRAKLFLASKCGMTGVDGKRVIDGRPDTLKRTCDDSLRRLQTDVIDLYYLHRWDKSVPIEDSVGALADLVRAGKIRAIGLSEVSAATLRRAHAVHAVAAVQNEYSLWIRNPQIALLEACREMGVALVAFSPLARGYLGGALRDIGALPPTDIRRQMPRFDGANYAANLALLDRYVALAAAANCTPAQLALAWLLAQDDCVIPIPGTTRAEHLRDNVAAAGLRIDAALLQQAGALINERTVSGARYNAATQAEIDSESFAD